MFRYLLFFSIGLYLTLLIGGEDRGQLRAGLRGEYAIDLAPPAQPPANMAEAEEPPEASTANLADAAPADTIRILPAPEQPQPASLTLAPSEPALALLETPALPIGTITAEAANVRAEAGGTVIGRVERGEIVQIVEQVGDWMHVRIEGDGIEGFVHRSLIAEAGPSLGNATLFPAID